MRRTPRPLAALFLASFLIACGGNGVGFRVDNVSLSPDDIPIDTSSAESLRFGADIFDDRHDVIDARFQSQDGRLWIQLTRGTDPHWSAVLPLAFLSAYPAGIYRFDVHAEDDAGRRTVLVDAVRLKIRLE